MGNGKLVDAVGMGEVTVKGHEGRLVTFTKVHLVPSLHTKLLSVPHFTAKEFTVNFSGKRCQVSKEGKGVFLIGEKDKGHDHGLFCMRMQVVKSPGGEGIAALSSSLPL